MLSCSPVGLSYQGMPRESRVSLGNEAACSLLGMIKMMKVAAWIWAPRTYWAPGPAKHLPETSPLMEDRCLCAGALLFTMKLLSSGGLGGSQAMSVSQSWHPDETQTHVGLFQPWHPPHPDQCIDIKINEYWYQSMNHAVIWGWGQLTSSCPSTLLTYIPRKESCTLTAC